MNMLSCVLNREITVPLYEQLYDYIKTEIIEGRLEFQTKLPSKRKLAQHLHISGNTVETAYEQLAAEGYLEVKPRKGYYVMDLEDLEYAGVKSDILPIHELKKSYDYHFHPSQIDTEHFPFAQWRKNAKNAMDVANQELLLLGDAQGEYSLRREIATYLYHARGVICEPEQIVVGAGIEILLQQLVLLFERNSVYGVEDPGYHLFQKIIRSYGNPAFPLEVDEDGIKVESIEKNKIDVVYVTPSHHFPYGSVLSINRRTKLLNWASSSKHRFIIEDDYDSEFRYTGKSIPSLQSMDQFEKVIYLGSFSKSLIPSLRISYMVLPKSLMNQYKEKFSFYHSTVSRIDQQILTDFMIQGDFEKHLNKMRKLYRRKLDSVLTLLKPYQDKISIIGERSGLHIVLVVNNGMDETTLIDQAAKESIKIYPMSAYSIEKKIDALPEIILGFAGIPEAKLEDAIQLLIHSWGFSG
ncbi:MocR-like pyridoxine biosynthesis transcription factor PdxR [Bacillus cihuensis]|uniref:MocR-like pyridoxine biosynthesis transcription factor PdxR n=1 Tax=Bacillus cihuensis TaxID=1208599 RepID=UPI0004140048|nr:PLP-dependent aminotransferase family protein [Bacillus cihuensis]